MRSSLLLAAMLSLPGAATAQSTGTIAGRVTAAAGAAAVAGAAVQVYDGSRKTAAYVNTDTSGNYTAAGLAPGTYYVLVTATGFVQQLYAGVQCGADCVTGPSLAAAGTAVTVSSGATTTVNVALDRGGTISGRVTSRASGTPLGSAFVALYDGNTRFIRSAFAASDASFSFTTLPFGSYYLLAAATDYVPALFGGPLCPYSEGQPSCRVTQGSPVSIVSGAPTATATIALDAGGQISGTVRSANGTALLGVDVMVYQGGTSVLLPAGTSSSTVTTDSAGRYTATGLPTGAYQVRTRTSQSTIPFGDYADEWFDDVCVGCAGNPRSVTVTAGSTTTGIDFVLATGGAITGAVSYMVPSSSTIIPPIVQVYDARGVYVKSSGFYGAFSAIENGTGVDTSHPYNIHGLAPGTYYLRTMNMAIPLMFGSHPQPAGLGGQYVDKLYDNIVCVAADCAVTRGTPVQVTAGSAAVVNFRLDRGAMITGLLPTASHFNLDDAIEVYDSRGVQLPKRATSSNFQPSTGYFAAGLPGGTYYLLLRRYRSGDYPEILYKDIPCDGCSVTSGTPVTVALGETRTGIDFGLVASQSVRGIVRSNTGVPLSTITVEAYAANGERIASALSGADGTFELTRLVAGDYQLRTANIRGYVEAAPVAVTVQSGADTIGVQLVLTAGTSVSGFALAGFDSAPLAGVGVSLFTPSGGPVARAITGTAGRFEMTAAPGTYRAATDPYQDYNRKVYDNRICPRGICDIPAGAPISVSASPVTNITFLLTRCGAGTITPLRLAAAAVGVAYRQTLSAVQGQGGGPNLGLTIASGTLPPGLTFDPATRMISGTPTAAGSFTFTVAVGDDIGCTGTRTFTLDVPACAFTLGGSDVALRARGEPWLVTVNNACGTWVPASNAAWISIGSVTPACMTNVQWCVGIVAAPNTGGPRQGAVTIGPRVFTVFQSGAAGSPPFGAVDSPADGAVVTGSVAISGWALDDMSVGQVSLYRDPVAGEPAQLVFLGRATQVDGARPDVETAFPAYPRNRRAGWGYLLLTNMLPNRGNGTFRISVYATDSDLNRTLLGTRTINAVNGSATAPFGAIDTPDQGAIVSGSGYVNFGWALTPQPKLIPFDGSTISVVIDGVPVGNVTSYNLARSDVSGLFAGLKNSGGPVGYRVIDATALSEGVHTISWVVTDDAGQATGIGSRYFTVQNSAWLPSLRTASAFALPPAVSKAEIALADSTTAVPPRIDGVDIGRKAASLATLPVDADGTRTIEMRQFQRLELALSSEDAGCAPSYEGYLAANGELRELPIGSSLDRTGTFYWQPGPGFLGTYHLVFVRTTCDGTRIRIPVSVRIR